MDSKEEKKFLSKLRLPIHISYIQTYLLKTSMEETRKTINDYMEKGIIIEHPKYKDYYSLKNENSNQNLELTIKDLIKKNPNDTQLGKTIRELFK